MAYTDPPRILEQLALLAADRGVFGEVKVEGARLICRAKASAAPAEYCVEPAGDGWKVSLGTQDRWLSESIESQLVESRDSMEDLLTDELKDLDWKEPAPAVRHFRDDQRRYVFECVLARRGDHGGDLAQVRTFLLAFEGAFSQLGDMSSGSDASTSAGD